MAQIVSNHLNTDPIVKRYNGGSDEESLKFIEIVFGKISHHRGILKDNYSLDEVDIIILQLTQSSLIEVDIILNTKIKDIWLREHQI